MIANSEAEGHYERKRYERDMALWMEIYGDAEAEDDMEVETDDAAEEQFF